MELISNNTRFDFVRVSPIAFFLSGFLSLVAIGSMFWQGLNYGIDFAGGTMVQLRFTEAPSIKTIRADLTSLGLGDVVIQEFGDPQEIMIRVEQKETEQGGQAKLAQRIVEAVQPTTGHGQVELRRVEFVGPQVGQELRLQGVLAVLYSMVAILVYVAIRFEFRFALGAVIATLHDVIIILGYFSFFRRDFTLVVVAAVLTVIGYSLNDTIVVYDRIREEMKRMKNQPMADIINVAVNKTLSRTIITSFTVVLVLIALLLVGGEVIYDFSLALFIGVLIGTYSSIFVASPVVLLLDPKLNRHDGGGSPITPQP